MRGYAVARPTGRRTADHGLRLPPAAVTAMRAQLPEVAEHVVSAIIDEVPSYTDAFSGPMGETIGNAVQLEHVMRNLLENAIDAVRAVQGGARRVVVRIGRAEVDEVHISVADNGPGIPIDVADRLFDPFVSTKPGGMGMGLMFCRAVVEAHGGRIWPEANVPNGAAIHVSLPAEVPSTRQNGATITTEGRQ